MISQTVNGLERRVYFRPAFHKVSDDPKKNFGVHGLQVDFILVGPKGAIHFINYTGMMLKKTYDWWKATGRYSEPYKMHMGSDVGYHSPVKLFDNQELHWPQKMKKKEESMPAFYELTSEATKEEKEEALLNIKWEKVGAKPPICDFLGVPCYTDGSALKSEEWHEIWLEKGDDVIWEMMETEYKETFHESQT